MSPYVRTVKTASGATAVQIVHLSRRGSRDIERIGSAHDDAELEVLKAAAARRDQLSPQLSPTEVPFSARRIIRLALIVPVRASALFAGACRSPVNNPTSVAT